MKPISGKRMAKVLRRRGWAYLHTRGSHQYFVGPDGATIVTVPYHTKDMKPKTQRSIMKRAGLKDSDL
jgi:predicted RNA binding protein YcfA (HicA-like mRNA interferase family)